jgi:4-amino-4-deoxy-L-arabinose transferase-like glycosyltransferase
VYSGRREHGIGAGTRLAVAVVLGLQLLKLGIAAVLPLFGDEAFYLFEGRRFAPAYDDVPALLPWSLAIAEQGLGKAALALRLPALLLSWLTLALLWRIARDAVDAATAWRTLLLASLPPILAMNGVMALPDVGLNLAVLLCLRGLQQALRGQAGGAWLAAGLLLGWSSHYRFLVPLAAAGLWLLVDPAARRLLHNPSLQRGAALGLAAGLAPLVWHALGSAGGGFVFQFHERHPWQFQPQVLADPLLQAVAVGPLLYGLLLLAGLRALRGGDGVLRLAAALGLALLLLYWLLGPWVDSERSRLHWPAPGYLALALPLAATWRAWSPALRGATLATGLLLCAGGAGYLLAAALAPERLAGTRLYPHNFAGWETISADVRTALGGLPPGTVVLADNVTLAAQLDRALAPAVPVFSLDHPLNHKHGRAAELARAGRDEAAHAALAPASTLLVVELSASRLRERSHWLARLCQRFPRARWLGERQIGAGEKRLLLLHAGGDRPGLCAPGVVAYLEQPRPGAVQGWALAPGSGVAALRLRVAGRLLPLQHGMPLPSLAGQLGETGDPAFPRVGFRGQLPDDLPPGRHWLWLQARTPGRDWHDVLGQPLERPVQ